MNTSDYYCEKCNKIFEYKKLSSKESFPEQVRCPFCDKWRTRRKLTFNAIIPDHMKATSK